MISVPLISCVSVIVNDRRGSDWHALAQSVKSFQTLKKLQVWVPLQPCLEPCVDESSVWLKHQRHFSSPGGGCFSQLILSNSPEGWRRAGGEGRKVYLALSWSGSGCCGWEQNELLVMLQLIKPPTLWNTIKERMSLRCMCFPLSNSHYLRATGVCTNPAPTQLFIHPLKKVKSTSHRRLN